MRLSYLLYAKSSTADTAGKLAIILPESESKDQKHSRLTSTDK